MAEQKKSYPTKISLVLRMVVSAYLLYLVWELRGAPASHTGAERLLFIGCMILFFAVAVVLGGISLKAYMKGEYDCPVDGESAETTEDTVTAENAEDTED